MVPGTGGFGLDELLTMLIVLVLPIWFSTRVLSRAGYSKWWSVTIVIPVVGLIMVWIFAYGKWPVMESTTKKINSEQE